MNGSVAPLREYLGWFALVRALTSLWTGKKNRHSTLGLATCVAVAACSQGKSSDTAAAPVATLQCSALDREYFLGEISGELDGESSFAERVAYRRHQEWMLRKMLAREEIVAPGFLLGKTRNFLEKRGPLAQKICVSQLHQIGKLLFQHEYSFADGLGSKESVSRADPFRKVHDGELGGPETISCTSCHWKGGFAGAGDVVDNSQLFGDGRNIESATERNPPALWGVGVVQALAQEMSLELQQQRDEGIRAARAAKKEHKLRLESKGIDFGVLRVFANGKIDASSLVGVDEDLSIRPFGWRGEFASLRDFAATSTQVHLGIQSRELIEKTSGLKSQEKLGSGHAWDPDEDKHYDELSEKQMTALVSFLALLPMPDHRAPSYIAPLAEWKKAGTASEDGKQSVSSFEQRQFDENYSRGKELFVDVGCALCHRPMLVLKEARYRTQTPGGEEYSVDLSKIPGLGLHYDDELKGYPVWLFSDMRRHDMGLGSEEKTGVDAEKSSVYLTRRLWGLGSTSPYFYDGRAPDIESAIEAHGGEAETARENYTELSRKERADLRVYLMTLRPRGELFIP